MKSKQWSFIAAEGAKAVLSDGEGVAVVEKPYTLFAFEVYYKLYGIEDILVKGFDNASAEDMWDLVLVFDSQVIAVKGAPDGCSVKGFKSDEGEGKPGFISTRVPDKGEFESELAENRVRKEKLSKGVFT